MQLTLHVVGNRPCLPQQARHFRGPRFVVVEVAQIATQRAKPHDALYQQEPFVTVHGDTLHAGLRRARSRQRFGRGPVSI